MKEHKVLLAFIRSTYWMRKALEEDWQGSSFAGWPDKKEIMPAARERLSGRSTSPRRTSGNASRPTSFIRLKKTRPLTNAFFLSGQTKKSAFG
jgi:hypothetical protein